jgi:hypothetical protein
VSVDPRLLIEAARLVDAITSRAEQDAAAFEFAFRLGYGHGYDVGHAHAEREMAEAWRASARDWNSKIHPESADSRVRAAEAEVRRMALRHEQEFAARRQRGRGAA